MTAAVMLAATLVLHNGKIWTGDGQFARSVTIEGNRIVALDAPPPDGARLIDLKGRLAVPGFIDNHVHFSWGAAALAQVRLRDAKSPQEFASRIAAQAKKLGKGKWITGGEWDEQLWEPYRLPERSMIDAVTPDNPVFVARLDGHMALANSVALKLAGITRETPDPPGGTIVRDANGEPTGLLKDAAMNAVYAVIPMRSIEERMAAARQGLAEGRAEESRPGDGRTHQRRDGEAGRRRRRRESARRHSRHRRSRER